MPIQNRSAGETHEAHEPRVFDLSELSELYGAAGLRTLLAVALDEFDGQRLAFDRAFQSGQWRAAAQALHRLAGTAAFFVRDECVLGPLNRAERALRLADAPLIRLTVPGACSVLALLRTAFVDELADIKKGR
ncbi:hypothetical protein [Trinickia sp.]|uniref:hypothetical protein n=1 Tax=Trinickia sp. TaxID=2571163 RepID=UPI003F7F39B3